MKNPVSLKSMEQQAFRVTLADGLWDVFIGCFVLIFAIAPVLSESLGDFWSSFIFLPFWGVVYLCIWLTRKYVVAPRLGRVSLGQARLKRLRKFNLALMGIIAALFIIGLAVVLFMESPAYRIYFPFFSSLFGLSGGLLLLAGFSIAALLLDYPRLYYYGLLLFLALLVGEWLYVNRLAAHHGFPIVFGLASAIIIITGLVQFAYMLKANPAVQEGG